jgi:hypothetical protein
MLRTIPKSVERKCRRSMIELWYIIIHSEIQEFISLIYSQFVSMPGMCWEGGIKRQAGSDE